MSKQVLELHKGTYKKVHWRIVRNEIDRGGMEFYTAYVRLPYKHPYRKFCLSKRNLDLFFGSWEARKAIATIRKEPFNEVEPKRKYRKRFIHNGYEKMNIHVHGGLTFSQRVENLKWDQQFTKGNWIGWDYGHAGDKIWNTEKIKDLLPEIYKLEKSKTWIEKDWTLQEVFGHILDVIDQVLAIKK